jgi:hypothetical protein
MSIPSRQPIRGSGVLISNVKLDGAGIHGALLDNFHQEGGAFCTAFSRVRWKKHEREGLTW